MYNDESRQNDEEYMRSLYLRFRQDVQGGAPIGYYELTELLDIYDYAQDEGDAMVEMFVFLTVARLYPDSHDFDERMAFFVSYLSQDSAKDMLNRQGREETPLWNVLRMAVACYPDGNPAPYLEEILNKFDSFDSETLIKIIDLLRDMDRCDLLLHYFPEISKRAEDSKGFAFEVAEALKENDKFREEARKLAEEVTRQEPFDIEAWLLLARIESGSQHPEEALAAVDYALAIDPQNFNARLTRGAILASMPDKHEDAIDILTGILKEEPDNIYALEKLAEAYSLSGMKSEACEIFLHIIDAGLKPVYNPDPYAAIIALEPDNLEVYLARMLGNSDITEYGWAERAIPLIEQGRLKTAARYLDFYHRYKCFYNRVNFFLHLLYDAGMFARFIEVAEEVAGKEGHPASMPGYFRHIDYLLMAAAYLRTGKKEEAAEISHTIESQNPQCSSIPDVIEWRGIKVTAQLIYTLATSRHTPEELAGIDPMANFK